MSSQRKHIQVYPLNRVEGDLKIRLSIEDNVVTDAWSAGTMYRGFENILKGRGALDGLVITPRICGICTTAHLNAAAKALDAVAGVDVPDDAKRIRNATLMVEMLQNDVRHSGLLFMSDFARPEYRQHSLYEPAMARYAAMKGRITRQVIRKSQEILEIVAILGGQWPHSSFMVPGGVVSLPHQNEIMQCAYLLSSFREWYEAEFLGCKIERWQSIHTRKDLDDWLDEAPSHAEKEVGFFLRFAREAGLDAIGGGYGHFLTFGGFDLPKASAVKALAGEGETFFPPIFIHADGSPATFEQSRITEDISHAWFDGYTDGRHPMNGMTRPYATGSESDKYSWAKAPRYDGYPMETGPLAQMLAARRPLFMDLIRQSGPNVLVRQLARMVRPALIIPALSTWLDEICCKEKRFFKNYAPIEYGDGYGLTEAPRGALGHWIKIREGKIAHYQIITPSAWQASPRDSNNIRGPWEKALIGTEIRNPESPVEVDHVLRSFDPCLVCTVHTVKIT